VTTLLVAVAVLGTGTIAGVLVSVAGAIAPTFVQLPGERYVQVHQLLDRRFDPLMPILNALTMVGTIILVVVRGYPVRLLYIAVAVLMALVAAVSGMVNVPINRKVLAWDADHPPREWAELRTRWARWNLVRTVFAIGAFVASTTGAVLR
jgi:uncharacterized membrane protein